MDEAYYPRVTNALLRVENVPEEAPVPFENIEIEGYGNIWVYELLGIETPLLNEWSLSAIPELARLAPILNQFPGTKRFLHIGTEPSDPRLSYRVRFPFALTQRVQDCGAEIEHCIEEGHLE